MNRRLLAVVTCGVLILACVLVGPQALQVPAADDDKKPAEKEAHGKDIFGLTRV